MGKKVLYLILIVMLCSFFACNKMVELETPSNKNKQIDILTIGIVPMTVIKDLIETTEPLKELLVEKLKEKGWQVDEVLIHVGSSYESVGDALQNGTVDLAIISQGVYEEYKQGCKPLLRALRYQLSKDFSQKDTWLDITPTDYTEKIAENYRGILLAGPSEVGKDLANKIQQGEKITFEMVSKAKWSVLKNNSPAGRVFANKWLEKNYKKTLEDLPYLVQVADYQQAFARLANHRADVIWIYTDARMDFSYHWNNRFGMKNTIWEDTAVIGVSQPIPNEIIAVTTHSNKITLELEQGIQDAFIELSSMPQARKAFAVMGHIGYKKI